MTSATTQVNVRLAPDEVRLVDVLRRTEGSPISRAELLRSLLREKRRVAVDLQIAAAYDAAGPADDDIAESSAAAAGEVLADL